MAVPKMCKLHSNLMFFIRFEKIKGIYELLCYLIYFIFQTLRFSKKSFFSAITVFLRFSFFSNLFILSFGVREDKRSKIIPFLFKWLGACFRNLRIISSPF